MDTYSSSFLFADEHCTQVITSSESPLSLDKDLILSFLIFSATFSWEKTVCINYLLEAEMWSKVLCEYILE